MTTMKKHLNIQTVNSAEDLAEGQKRKYLQWLQRLKRVWWDENELNVWFFKRDLFWMWASSNELGLNLRIMFSKRIYKFFKKWFVYSSSTLQYGSLLYLVFATKVSTIKSYKFCAFLDLQKREERGDTCR